MDFILRLLPLLMKGVLMTLKVFVFSAMISCILGTFLGILTCHYLKIPFLGRIVSWATFVLRAVPFYIQLMIVYFVIPELLGWNFSPFVAAVVALGVCSSSYVAQIVKAGINTIPLGQWETAFVLGLTKRETLWFVILPQMIKNVLPTFNNELDALLKSTAIVSSIGLLELTRVGMNLVSREMKVVPIYLAVALCYLCLSALLNRLTKIIERRVGNVNY